MVKEALKSAFGPSLGVTLGGQIIPRIIYSERYNETYPTLFKNVAFVFIILYSVCFLVSLLTLWLKEKCKDKE